jgi:hypothetical protein
MHDGDDLNEIGSHPVDYSEWEMRHPALANIAVHKAVGLRMALYAVQRIFEIVEEALREDGLFSL